MDRSSIFLSLAILMIFFIHVSALGYPYLILDQILLSNLFGLVSAIFLYLAYVERGKEIKNRLNLSFYLIFGITLFFTALIFDYLGMAVIISIAGIMIFGHFSKKLKAHKLYAFLLAGIIITSGFSSIFILRLWGISWKGVDEIAYGYYASYFVLHGKNPYLMSMVPSLAEYNTPSTLQLNGSIEKGYNYPALSLLPTVILSSLKVYSYASMPIIAGLIAIAVSFLVYYKSNYNKTVLVPIAIWLFATYDTVPTVDQYLAVAVFLLLAYLFRKRIGLYGVLLGLAASTIQLAWFAMPFFFILTLKEEGRGKMLQSILVSVIVFLLINGYFMLQAPKSFMADVFGLFGTSKLLPGGPDIMQFFIRVYPVSLWVPAAISLVTFLSLVILYYFYTATLKPFIAIAPIFIFYLSWRNLEYYSLPFIPLIILLCYLKEKKGLKDMLKNRMYIFAALAGIMLFSLALVMYSHAVYAKANTLQINYISPSTTIGINNNYDVNSLKINISDNGNSYENASFFYFDPRSRKGAFVTATTLAGIPPHSYQNYTLNVNIPDVENGDRLYVMAFSKDYITWKSTYISLAQPNKSS
jgi:uncharacterized membrane protein